MSDATIRIIIANVFKWRNINDSKDENELNLEEVSLGVIKLDIMRKKKS